MSDDNKTKQNALSNIFKLIGVFMPGNAAVAYLWLLYGFDTIPAYILTGTLTVASSFLGLIPFIGVFLTYYVNVYQISTWIYSISNLPHHWLVSYIYLFSYILSFLFCMFTSWSTFKWIKSRNDDE